MMNLFKSLLAATAALAATLTSQPPIYKQGICNILALSGGGAFGAVEMGILDGLTGSGQAPATYDILTGISAGGLNAGFLSYYTNISQALPDIYTVLTDLTTEAVYESALLNILTDWSVYTTSPLQKTLTQILSQKKVSAAGKPMTLIGASNVLTEQLDVWHFETLGLPDRVATLMATSAIPFVFPPQKINGSLYVDGGVISNELIHQAMGQLICDSYAVTFISASAHSTEPKTMPTGLLSYTGAVVSLLVDTFDSQLAQVTNCSYPRGTLNACFPTSPSLGNFSILNFDHGAELYALGRSAFRCQKLPLC